MKEKFIIGTIGSPSGLNGFVKVFTMSGETSHLLGLSEVPAFKDGKKHVLKIEEIKTAPAAVLMRFKGIDSPEKAKTLGGAKLIGGREQAVPLEKDEFYIEDLKNLPVNAENGDLIGYIKDIIEGGGGELAEIKLANGEIKLVPFRKEFFHEISPQNKKIVMNNLWILE